MRPRVIITVCLAAVLPAVLAGSDAGPERGARRDAKPSTTRTVRKEASNDMDAWLRRGQDATPKRPRAATSGPGVNPFRGAGGFSRADAVPGVVELSDGRQLAGGVLTTREKPLIVFVEEQKRWRRIPLIAALSVQAVIVEEKMDLHWRWKAMGEPERVYTGKRYPTRRLKWRFRLIDGSIVTGTIKGQPVSVECAGQRVGPFVLHERSRGKVGQSLKDLVYVKQIVLSRRMMTEVLAHQKRSVETSGPRPPRRDVGPN